METEAGALDVLLKPDADGASKAERESGTRSDVVQRSEYLEDVFCAVRCE